jgi:hypothetical protein
MSSQSNNNCKDNKNKRHHSTSSLSPKVVEKKSKVFASPNRFSVLANTDEADANPCSKTANSHNSLVSTKPPPVYIKDVNNFSDLISILLTILDSSEFICKSTPSYTIIYTHFREHYNSLVELLEEKDYCFHTFQPNAIRPLRVVIRNIHPTTSHEDISASLAELGHSVTNIHNIKRFSDKAPLPLFFVDIKKATNNLDIYKIEFLLNTKITVEKPRTPKSPPQCTNCQSYGHTHKYCFHYPRCVKCGEKHTSESCTKSRDVPAKCALCNGNHTANYKGCPEHKKFKHIKSSFSRNNIPTPSSKNSTPKATFCTPSTQPSYAHVTSSGLSHSQFGSNIETLLTSFISEISNIIKPLLSLLTSLLNKS